MIKQQSRGFTLIELLIGIAIIGILTSLGLPAYQRYVHRAEAAELVLKMDRLRGALTELESTTGKRIGGELRVFTHGNELQWCQAASGSRNNCAEGSTQPLSGISASQLAESTHGVKLLVQASSALTGSSPGTFFVICSPKPGDVRSQQVALAFVDLMKPYSKLVAGGSAVSVLAFQLAAGARSGSATP